MRLEPGQAPGLVLQGRAKPRVLLQLQCHDSTHGVVKRILQALRGSSAGVGVAKQDSDTE